MRWLPNSHSKALSSVKLIFEEPIGQNYSGFYSPGLNIITVVHNNCIKTEASTIAHEYRHHIQYELGMFDFSKDVIVPNSTMPYEEMIAWYFHTSPKEKDALLYQVKYANSDLSEWWLKHLVDPRSSRCRRRSAKPTSSVRL